MKLSIPACAFVLAALASAAVGCGGHDEPYDSSHEVASVKEARASFPTVLALHQKVIARSCSPANGVCHNGKEYPDMHTPGNFVSVANKPCNEDKSGDPLAVYDGCEPEADRLNVASAGFTTRIGSISADIYDSESVHREMTLENLAPASVSFSGAKFFRAGQVVASVPSNVTMTEGSRVARLENFYSLDYQTYLAIGTLVGGDPNQNGTFGNSDAWREISPGRPEQSYLVGRITGTVPGSRMPLANQALSDPEYVAIFCWIESISTHPTAEDRIDYDGCRFAKNPTSYAN